MLLKCQIWKLINVNTLVSIGLTMKSRSNNCNYVIGWHWHLIGILNNLPKTFSCCIAFSFKARFSSDAYWWRNWSQRVAEHINEYFQCSFSK